MAPSLVWGIGIGLLIAAIDAVSIALMGVAGASEWPIPDADFLANVALYTLIGFRVGKQTGVVREAAEGGVIAGVIVGLFGIGVTLLLNPPVGGIDNVSDAVGVLAQNVALGGVLAIVSGWFGTRAAMQGPPARR